MGARLIHLVDFGGARAGVPVETEAIGAIASRVAVPIQLAGGLASADAIRLVFAAGATRVVLGTASPTSPTTCGRACRSPATGSRWAWIRGPTGWRPSVAARVAADGRDPRRRAGRRRGRTLRPDPRRRRTDLERVRSLVRTYDAEFLLAGGVRDLDGLRRSRDAGVAGVILGEALMSGAIDYPEALAAAA